jgi:hypothetical protein
MALVACAAFAGVCVMIALALDGAFSPSASEIAHLRERTAYDNAMRARLEADVVAARQYVASERARAYQHGYNQG